MPDYTDRPTRAEAERDADTGERRLRIAVRIIPTSDHMGGRVIEAAIDDPTTRIPSVDLGTDGITATLHNGIHPARDELHVILEFPVELDGRADARGETYEFPVRLCAPGHAAGELGRPLTVRQALEVALDRARELRSQCDQQDPEQREAARNASAAITHLEDAGYRFTRALAYKLGVQSDVDLELVGAAGARPERERFLASIDPDER